VVIIAARGQFEAELLPGGGVDSTQLETVGKNLGIVDYVESTRRRRFSRGSENKRMLTILDTIGVENQSMRKMLKWNYLLPRIIFLRVFALRIFRKD